MKIYYKKTSGSQYLYFIDSKADTLFHAYVKCDDMDTVYVSVVMTSDEKAILKSAVPVSQENAELFNRSINQSKNIDAIASIVRSVYPEVTDADFYRAIGRDTRRSALTSRIISETGCPIYFATDIYNGLKHYIKLWSDDDDRIVEYYKARLVPEMNEQYHGLHPMIDVFGDVHPTAYSLLHSFHSVIVPVDEPIDKAVETYPDEVDIDKAYYLAKKLINEAIDEYIKGMKKQG